MEEDVKARLEALDKRPEGTEKRFDDIKWYLGGVTGLFMIGFSGLTDDIRQSRTDSSVFPFYKAERPRRWVCAVAKREGDNGFLITAYPTDAIQEGAPVWPR